jgi:hypothetical protein
MCYGIGIHNNVPWPVENCTVRKWFVYPLFLNIRKNSSLLEVPILRPLDFLTTAVWVWSIEEMLLTGGRGGRQLKYWEKKLSHYYIFHHKCHVDRTRINPGAGVRGFSIDTSYIKNNFFLSSKHTCPLQVFLNREILIKVPGIHSLTDQRKEPVWVIFKSP